MSGSCAPTATSEETAEPPSAGWLQIATTSSATTTKRRPAGTPDPDAEVVALSLTLLESRTHVCEVCDRGFRRASHLQMHRLRQGVPRGQRRKREAGNGKAAPAPPARKRVFVCPEPSCLHHHPAHALSCYSAIKQHFRRQHDPHRRWDCHRCSRSYAVRGDYKAHLKACRTGGVRYPCHCGRVFYRVDKFVIHQQSCGAAGVGAGESSAAAASQQPAMALSRSSDIIPTFFHRLFHQVPPSDTSCVRHNLQLQLMPSSCHEAPHAAPAPVISRGDDDAIQLQLSIGLWSGDGRGREEFRPSSLHLQAPVRGVAAAASQQPAMALPLSGWASPSSEIVAALQRVFGQVPPPSHTSRGGQNLELQLIPPSSCHAAPHSSPAPISRGDDGAIQLQLSMGPCIGDDSGGEQFRPSSLHLQAPRGRARWRRAYLVQGGAAAGDGSGGRAGAAPGAGGAAAACGGVSELQRAMLGFPSWTAA